MEGPVRLHWFFPSFKDTRAFSLNLICYIIRKSDRLNSALLGLSFMLSYLGRFKVLCSFDALLTYQLGYFLFRYLLPDIDASCLLNLRI